MKWRAERLGRSGFPGDHDIEGLHLLQERIGTGANTLQAREIECDELEASSTVGSCFAHLCCCSFSLREVPGSADHLSCVRCEGACCLDSNSSRNADHENALALKMTPESTSSVVEVASNILAILDA